MTYAGNAAGYPGAGPGLAGQPAPTAPPGPGPDPNGRPAAPASQGSPWWASNAATDPWRDPYARAVVVQQANGSAGPPLEPLPPIAPTGYGPRRSLGFVLVLASTIALVAGLLGGALGYVAAARTRAGSLGTADGSTADAAQRKPESVAGVVAGVMPSVVTVLIESDSRQGNGSGFVISSDGYILTNDHVAEAASGGTLRVVFSDGTVVPAKVSGTDPESDLAVLKVDRSGSAAVRFGDSDRAAVGDPVLAIGAPLGLQNTVTYGIISALDRPVKTGEDGGQTAYLAAIQTDAAINPGNSGGPLIDGAGRVVGVNSAIATFPGSDGKGGNIGLGFAIPINQARRVAQDIISTGRARRTVIGATLDTEFTSVTGGVRLQHVEPGGPAARAGLHDGDVVTRFDSRVLSDSVDLVALIRKNAPGTVVPVEYTRNGARRSAEITLAADAK